MPRCGFCEKYLGDPLSFMQHRGDHIQRRARTRADVGPTLLRLAKAVDSLYAKHFPLETARIELMKAFDRILGERSDLDEAEARVNAAFARVLTRESTAEVACPACGTAIPSDANICYRCGYCLCAGRSA